MSFEKGKWWGLIALIVLAILLVVGMVGFRMAAFILKGKVVEALGPGSEIKDIRMGWTGVHVEGLRIRAPSYWPSEDTLRAERVTLVPSLLSLLSGQYRIRSITIVDPYLSVFRTKDGKVLVVPSLVAKKGQAEIPSTPSAAPPAVILGRITLQDGVVELFDATVAHPFLKVRLEQIRASVKDLAVPTLNGRSRFDFTGVVKGVHQDGSVKVAGWAVISTRDSSVNLQLRSVDLMALQPYLIKAGDIGVRKGTLDLDLQSDVSNNRLKAPGKVTISDLKLAPATGAWGTFMGVPRDAMLTFLKSKGDKITLNFILEGDISNPTFSLSNVLAERLAVSMAEVLKVSLGGVARGAAGLGEEGVETVGEVIKGIGGAMQQILGGQKKH
jgi:Domain of Unknown Function (DUF748)